MGSSVASSKVACEESRPSWYCRGGGDFLAIPAQGDRLALSIKIKSAIASNRLSGRNRASHGDNNIVTRRMKYLDLRMSMEEGSQ